MNFFAAIHLVVDSSTTLLSASLHPDNSKRLFYDNIVGLPDYLSQTLNTKIGQVYRISFWLQNKSDALNDAQVVMSY
jgi:hypothetical protein